MPADRPPRTFGRLPAPAPRTAKEAKRQALREALKQQTMADLFSILDAPPAEPGGPADVASSSAAAAQPQHTGATPSPTAAAETGAGRSPETPASGTAQPSDAVGDSQASSLLLDSDDLFLTELEHSTARRLQLAADELDFLLQGAGPQVAPGRREAALRDLLQWLQGTDHAGAHLRALGRLGDVTRAACHWTADHHRSGVGLAVLQHVVADPLNRHHVSDHPEIWDTFWLVLEAAVQPGPAEKQPVDKDAEEVGRPLKRKRSFLQAPKASGPGAHPPPTTDCNGVTVVAEDDPGVQALQGLTAVLLSISNADIEAEARASPALGPPTPASPAGRRLQRWFLQRDGYALLCRVLATAGGPTCPRLRKALEFLELMSSTPAEADLAGGGLPPLVEALLDLLEAPRLAALASAAGPSTVDVLQILLNLCAQGFARPSGENSAPDDMRAGTTLRLMRLCCRYLAAELATEAGDTDLVHYCLCLLANLTERQPHARREAAALPCGAGPLIPFLVRHFDAALGAGTTAGNVLAGYLAHLLGCLTIQNDDNRSSVRAELLQCETEADPSNDPNAGNPMVRLVLVLQQFLLFQSAAHVLTHSTLVGVHYVLTQLVTENGIVLPKASG
eukprot:EG_transcript_4553